MVTAVPLTSNVATVFPFQALIDADDSNLHVDSKAQVEQVRSVSVTRVGRVVGRVPLRRMLDVDSLPGSSREGFLTPRRVTHPSEWEEVFFFGQAGALTATLYERPPSPGRTVLNQHMTHGETPIHLAKGGNVELASLRASLGKLTVLLQTGDTSSGEVVESDVSILLVDESGSVPSNDCFVFYNQPVAFGGAVHLRETLRSVGESVVVSMITLSLDDLPDEIQRVIVVGSLDESVVTSFADSARLRLSVQDSDAADLVHFDVPQPSAERALLFGEFYRRGDTWKFRAIGQGYGAGLSAVAQEFGVEIADDAHESSEATEAGDEHESQPEVSTDDDTAAPRVDALVETPAVSVKRSVKAPRMPKDWNKSMPAAVNDLQSARLFPVAGIGGGEEQERRATSAFLAVLAMVRPFSRSLLSPLGAHAGGVDTFVEVPFSHKEEAYRPDGMIVVRRGQKVWRALVEVKTGSNDLAAPQVETYVDIARDQGYDCVLTISNQLPTSDGEHPVTVDRRKLKKVALVHLSWDEVRSAAHLALDGDFPDATQRLVLEEFLRYMDHDRSGLHGFNDMGKRWAQVRDSSRSLTLRLNDAGTTEIVDRFDQLMQHTALELTNVLGVRVRTVQPEDAPDQASRRQQLVDSGVLFGSLRVPGAVNKMVVRADIRTDTVSVNVTARAPKTARADTRVRWILRQLAEADASARIESISAGPRPHVQPALLVDTRENPKTLLHADGREAKEFRVTYSVRMGQKRASGTGTLIGSVVDLVTKFYAEVVQEIDTV